MDSLKTAVFVVLSGLSVVACGPKEEFGTVSGVLAGSFIGSQMGGGATTTAFGAVVGGLIGQQIGASMDADDRKRAWEAQYRALQFGRPGEAVRWRSDRTGDYGQVVAGPRTGTSTICRNYTHTIYIAGREQIARGKACRQNDGTWAIVN